MYTHDVCVVGAGMVGSATAKWLTNLQPEAKICLLGPKEPTEEEWRAEKREVFSSHYDEGRLTREVDESPVWGVLAQRSIQRYREIEKESGIKFYQEVGCVYADVKNGQRLQKTIQNAEKIGINSYQSLNASLLQDKFPYLHLEKHWQMLFNFRNAGYISPRNLVAAQQKIAASHGCDVISDVAVKIQEKYLDGGACLRVTCQSGQQVTAKQVLLCTGAFTNCYDLLPEGKQINFSPIKVTVVKAEVSEDEAKTMEDMPGILSRIPGKECYILPPIKYPDGKYYVKIGGYDTSITVLHSHREITEWFRSEGRYENEVDKALDTLKFIVPDLKPISVTTSCCSSSHTPTKLPYLDMVTPRLGVAVGLCGQGAKSSDEIARMGAQMITKGAWDNGLPAGLFRKQYKGIVGSKL